MVGRRIPRRRKRKKKNSWPDVLNGVTALVLLPVIVDSIKRPQLFFFLLFFYVSVPLCENVQRIALVYGRRHLWLEPTMYACSCFSFPPFSLVSLTVRRADVSDMRARCVDQKLFVLLECSPYCFSLLRYLLLGLSVTWTQCGFCFRTLWSLLRALSLARLELLQPFLCFFYYSIKLIFKQAPCVWRLNY